MMISLFPSTFKLSTFKLQPMRKLFIFISAILISTISIAQETSKDTLKTEEILVVKPYTPKISDAFKIKINPTLDSLNQIQKENVSYSIFSIPVASTFTPSKGKAQTIKKASKERLFDNYITAGFGNFTSPLIEAYIHSGDPRYNDFGLFLNHHSSEGGIKDVLLNDSFANTRIDGYYKQYDRYYNWQINAGVQRELYNYYGLPSEMTFDDAFIESLDEKQIYKNFYVGGKVSFEDSVFKGVSAELVNLSDNYNSNEFRFLVKPKVEFPISTELINAEFSLDYLSGSFKQDYTTSNEVKYNFFNLGFSPNFEVLRDNLTLNLGAKLYYANDLEAETNEFYAYPNVDASLKLVDDVFILVAGVNGDLEQNSYRNFSQDNPYVSPTLNIQQTDKKYRAYIGAKGKLASNASFNFNVSHTNAENRPIFIKNPSLTNGSSSITHAFQAGNSFNIIYDNVKSLDFYGEITIDASKEFNLGASINYSNFTPENEAEVWNTPEMRATVSANYNNNSWFAGAKLFYRGETKDVGAESEIINITNSILTNESYIDLNFNGGYIFSDRLSAFAKINNALGKKYFSYTNYQVQTLQILAGITYKFDL